MKKALFYLFLFFTIETFAQVPANDNCTGAISLGTLGAPGACGAGSTGTNNGTTTNYSGTIVGATPENPYTTLLNCTGGTMAAPGNDVWYSFIMPTNGYGVVIAITGATFSQPNIALWTGSCTGLVGIGCAVGAGGAVTLNIPSQMVPGHTYYIQLSGATGQSGTFNMALNAFQDCADCLVESNFTVTPAPVNGMYQPGQTVQFCFQVLKYDQVGDNWLHGVQFTPGNGWNAASIVAGAPPATVYNTGGGGGWGYYPTGETSNIGPTAWPPGFYFDADGDGNPGNNYGDGGGSGTNYVCIPGGTKWTFCISITVNTTCNPGANLSMVMGTSGDGQSGGYTNPGCQGDPKSTFNAVQACCPPTVATSSVLCNGGTTGSATATAVVGGAGDQDPYVFAWTGTAAQTNTVTTGVTNTFPNLGAGTYTVTVTDKNLCTASTTLTITQPAALAATATPHNITCAATGSITTTAATGGTSPYTYAWAGPGAYTSAVQSPTGLTTPGVYTLTVTDHNNCTFTTTATVAQTGAITVTVNNPSICSGAMATLTAAGGTTYSWTAGLSGTTGASVTGSPATTTSYTVIGTTGTCTNSAVATINVTTTPTVAVNSATICPGGTATLTASGATTYNWTAGVAPTTGSVVTTSPGATTSYTVTGTTGTCTNSAVVTVTIGSGLSVTVNNATVCVGGSTTLTAVGATTYSWTPAAGLSGTTGASVTANPAATSTYVITGTTGGCTGTGTAVVTVSPNPTVTVTSTSVCSGNPGTITASGATTYSWNTGATTAAITQSPAATTSYTVTGTTATCTNTAVGTITVNPNPAVSVTSTSVCSGNSGTITASGATTYSWNTGATTAGITVTPAGTTSYTVTGTGANSCTSSAVGTVSVSASVTIAVNDPSICPGSTTTLTATGATTYSWNTGETTPSIVVTPGGTTNYTATGVQNGCTGTSVGTVSVVPNPTVTVAPASICLNGSTTLTAAGSSHYTWTPAAGLSSTTTTTVIANPTVTTTYTIIGAAGTCTTSGTTTVTVNALPVLAVTSSTICVGQQVGTLGVTGASTYTWTGGGITGSNATNPTDNPANTTVYTVNGTNAQTCTATATGTITVNSLPVLTVTSASVCSGFGPATLGVTGASTYTWTGGGITGSNATNPTDNPANTTVYTVNGTNAQTCTATATGTITVMSTPTISVNSGAICAGQTTLVLNATSNATAFVWTPATGLSATTGNSVTANPPSMEVYTITGSIGTCTVSTTATVTVNTPPVLTVTGSTICVGQQVGTLGVTGASTYTWTGGGITGSNATNPTDNPTNTTIYTVNGIDVNTCTATATGTITVNSLPTVTATSGTVCVGQQTVTITASGASTYVWAPATGLSATTGNSVMASPPSTQNYVITGTDINGCTNTGNTSVLVNTLPTVSATSTFVCPNFAGNITASGASTYVWNTGATGATLTQTPAITTPYSVIGTDVNGCTNSATATITVYPSPMPVAASNTPCANLTLSLTCTPNGFSNYSWAGPNAYSVTAQQNPSITGVTAAAAGIYTVFVTDVHGCKNDTTVTVVINPLPVVTAVGSTVCANQTISLSCTPNGDTYSWSGQAGAYTSPLQNPTIPNATVGMSGTYAVTVIDANSCINAAFAQVLVNQPPIVTATSGTICVGKQTTLTASGASTYVWNSPATLSGSMGPSVIGFPTTSTAYTVTGTDVNGCVGFAVDSITVNPLPVVTTSPIPPNCIPLNVVFTATSTPAANSYIWNYGNGQTPVVTNNPSSSSFTGSATYTASGTFPVTLAVTDIQGCVNTATTSVTTFAIPVADFDYGQQPVTILDPTVLFYNESTPGLPYYNWNFGDTYSTQANDTSGLVNPSHLYSVVDTFFVTLTVSTISGCSATVTKPIIINEYATLYVPNAFSPNGDGKNELFLAEGVGISTFKMYIFDRWGLLLYYSEDITKGWNGTYQAKGTQILQEDVYVWKIEATDFQNTNRNLHGTVTLLK